MKKFFFLSALLCASMMVSATNYCQTQVSTSQEAIDVTVKQTGPLETTFIFESEKLANRTVWQNCDPSNLGGGTLSGANFAASTTITYTNGKLTCVTTWTTYPTSYMTIYFSLYRDNSSGGSDIMTFTLDNINPGAVCIPDSERPVMGEASLASVSGNKAVINVAATDNVGVTKYHVVNTTPAVDVELSPSAGTITVTGLTGSTTYNFTITAKDAAGNESANSASVEATTTAIFDEPQAAATAPTWPAIQVKAIYSPTYSADCNFANWSGLASYVQDTYGKKYEVGAPGYFGVDGFNHNCVAMEKLHYDIWIADDASIRIVPICRNDADSGNEPEVGKTVNLTGQQWNSIELDLATDYSAVTNWKHVYQVKIDNAQNLTFWVGNAYFYTTVDPTTDTQKPTDVTAAFASAEYFSATLTVSATDDSGTVNYIVKNGENEVASGSGASAANTSITVSNLTPNTAYTFHVIASDVAGNEANPVAVNATTIALPAAAPDPTEDAANVRSLYSNKYTPATTVSNYCENWWQAPTLHQTTLGESNNVLYYTAGATGNNVFGWAMGSYDFSGFQKLHLSVYPLAATTVEVYPVIAPEGEFHKVSEELTANQWNDVVYDYTEKTFTAMTQLGFILPHTAVAYFIDNVYFYKDDATAITNTEVEAKAVKVIENGQLFIIKNGVKYNTLGVEVR